MAGALITDNIHGMQNMTNILQSIVRRQLPSPPFTASCLSLQITLRDMLLCGALHRTRAIKLKMLCQQDIFLLLTAIVGAQRLDFMLYSTSVIHSLVLCVVSRLIRTGTW